MGGKEADEAVLGHVEVSTHVQGLQVLAQLEGRKMGETRIEKVEDEGAA